MAMTIISIRQVLLDVGYLKLHKKVKVVTEFVCKLYIVNP